MAVANALKWSWQQTMLRIKDPKKSLAFYTDLLGFTLVDKCDFPDMKFSLYFLATFPKSEPYTLTPGSSEAHAYLWNTKGVTIELTHNWGTESDADFAGYHPGNAEGDGFGHLAVNCDDVYAACEQLEKAGVQFKKKPDEGRMKGLAFAYDPDGYWIEIIKRGEGSNIDVPYNLSQTMLRVKDPKKTLEFYSDLGLTLVRELHFNDFSLYFMANLAATGATAPTSPEEGSLFCHNAFQPVLEFTHNHGTEAQPDFKYNNGNEAPKKGFGHIGFLVDDVDAACAELEKKGAPFVKKPADGKMKGLAFAQDPDGYWVEVVKRGGYDSESTPYFV
eukprot:NODE_942_length_1219_cov_27.776068_g715_i0.p1 GENE.NODE_942_length_1219_cov_27.776068_g715_i0~~NODE_942_length_1219_cov_27.776068_g715_i0.p1  ORF type:complete len:349 (-),score=98.18 NODE_942_length_1219_cov_27.776068_g715_i0:171-1166(-)